LPLNTQHKPAALRATSAHSSSLLQAAGTVWIKTVLCIA
jgi:hypothetical protein